MQGEGYHGAAARLLHQMTAAGGPAVAARPDLVMVAGPYLTLAGYPPYHVASAELYHLGPLKQVTMARIAAVIARFQRTSQRFGR